MIYNFEQTKDFFNSNLTYLQMKKDLSNELDSGVDKKIADTTLKLWAESVIKHNLALGMDRVDHIYLITEENSNGVKSLFGKIMANSKDKRTDKDYKVLQLQSLIYNYITIIAYRLADNNIDVYQSLKNDYELYSNPDPKGVKTKVKIK